ncbi:TonB-dependent receptor plug domain-containing protein [Caulobacter sp. LARHSG274]
MTRKMALLSVLACITPAVLHAQERQPRPTTPAETADPAGDNEVEALVVTAGQRLRGAVIGNIPPEETFTAADVRAFGVSSINELLAELAPQTESGRGGSPVVLLNGRRISSMAEIRDIPAEAIQRVEILPEEVALKYGYTAEQKVVNIVLRQRFRANTGELGVAAPTAGGQTSEQLDASTLRLNRDGRLNLAAKLQHSDALLESDRDLIADPDLGNGLSGDRSLLPRTDQASVNTVFNKALPHNVSATVNASGSFSRSAALLGSRNDVALEQNSRDFDGHLGFTVDGDAKTWRWSLTGNYDHGYDRTLTDRSAETTDRARTITDGGNLQLVANGTLARLPAGDLSTTVKLGAEGSSLDAVSRRSTGETSSDLSRTGANAQLNFDLPITSRKNNVLAGMGDLSANLNLAVNRLSDFGALTTVGYGLTWSPIKPVSFIVSMTQQENAPTMSQLGAPAVARPDSRIFDFVRGETVQVTRITGGNPDLKAEERHVLKIGVTLRPPNITGLSLNANYFRTRIDDPIASFPAATAATKAAFPDRFTRDADGDLTRVDARPVNFARQESDQLRWGINFTRQIGKTPPRPAFNPDRPWPPGGGGDWRQRRDGGQASGQDQTRPAPTPTPGQAAATDQTPNLGLLQGALPPGGGERSAQPDPAVPAAGDVTRSNAGPGQTPGGPDGPGGPGGWRGERGPGGFGGFGPPGGGAARLQLALFHTVHLRERVFIGDGSLPLDLLNGDALNSSGGQPQHEVEAQAGITKNGLGARLTASWRSATRVDGSAAAGNLRFSDLTTINLRLFANLGARRDWVAAHPFLRGSRVTFGITNLFDSKMSVHDASGAVPINYQPDYLDPLGRSVRLSFRKVFF